MDERIGILALFVGALYLVNFVDIASLAIAKRVKGFGSAAVGCLIAIPISLVIYGVAGWADMILWNMLAPELGLPTIDLITAIAIGWLIGALVRGITPMRVRDMHWLEKADD